MAWSLKSDDSGTPREIRISGSAAGSSPSFTPAANSLLFLAHNTGSDFEPVTLTGHGTWSSAVASIGISGGDSSWMYGYACKIGASPVADTVDITYGSGLTSLSLITEITGHDDTETIGNIFIQAGTGSVLTLGSEDPFGISAPFSSFATDSLLLVAGGSGTSEVTFTPVAPLVEHFETAGAGNFEVSMNSSETEDLTPELTPGGFFRPSVIMAFELKAAGAGGGSVHQSIDPRRRGRIVI